MEELKSELLNYIKTCYHPGYNEKEIKINGSTYFFVLDTETYLYLTTEIFVRKYYPAGKERGIKNDCFILSDYKSIAFLDVKICIANNIIEFPENFIFSINESNDMIMAEVR